MLKIVGIFLVVGICMFVKHSSSTNDSLAYQITIEPDSSFPGWKEYDYSVENLRVYGQGTEWHIWCDIHNLALCEARSAWGWYSPNGRSCWGEWDFEYNEWEIVDIKFRVGDSSPEPGAEYRIELDNLHLGDVQIPATNSWYIVTIHNVSINTGSHTLFLGTYQMDYYPDIWLDYILIGDLRIEAEKYNRMGGNDPNPDLRGLWVNPMDIKVQFWDGNPDDGGQLISEKLIGEKQLVIDRHHEYPENTFYAHYIENNGIFTAMANWTPTYGWHTIYVIVDPDNELEEINEMNNIVSREVFVKEIPPKSWLSVDLGCWKEYVTPWTEFTIWAYDEKGCYEHFAVKGPQDSKFFWSGNYYECNGSWHIGFNNTPVSFQLRDEKGHAPNGVYTIKYWAEDIFGNIEEIHTEKFKIDTKAPQTTLFFEGQHYITSKCYYISPSTEIVLSASDNGGSGTKITRYRVDNKIWEEYNSPIKIKNEGLHKISYYSNDKTGNEEVIKTIDIWVDATPPTTTILFDRAYVNNALTWINENSTIGFLGKDIGCGVNNICYRVDNKSWINYTTPFHLYKEGEHIIEFYAKDNLGIKENIRKMKVGVDNSPPTIILNSPKKGYLYLFGREMAPLRKSFRFNNIIIGSIEIKGVVIDSSYVPKVELYMDNQLQFISHTNLIDYLWNEPTFFKHTIEIKSYDYFGYSSSEKFIVWLFNM